MDAKELSSGPLGEVPSPNGRASIFFSLHSIRQEKTHRATPESLLLDSRSGSQIALDLSRSKAFLRFSMGAAQSSREREEEEDDDDEEEEDDDEAEEVRKIPERINRKVLEQEPEILPCRASASPLSPQLSLAGTPRVPGGASIKIWDPCNVLSPVPVFARFGLSDSPGDGGDRTVEIFLICHGECSLVHRPDLIGGRWPAAGLTGNGERQARALAVFLNSQGIRFNAVYSSPLDRSLVTAAAVCRVISPEICPHFSPKYLATHLFHSY